MEGVRFLVVLTLASLVFLTRLDAPLLEPQEPRYAEIARQMLVTDSWIVPVLHDQPYLDKPPLFYWAIMASYRLFGVHDWAARLVPGLAGVLTVLTLWFWGGSMLGPASGFWGAVVLCLSARFVYLERILTFDGLLCLWVTLALAAGERALRCFPGPESKPALGWWLLSASLCSLGILTKGPVALALVVPPLFLLRRSVLPFLLYGLVACFLAAPWFVAVLLDHPEFAGSFFWRHNVVRFLAPFDHAEPWWFHLPGLLLGMCPWVLLLPGMVRQQSLRFLLLTSGWCLLFFSLAGCKRAVYILPALPPLALALGHQLTLAARQSTRATWGSALVLFLAVGLLGIAGWNQLLPWPLIGVLAGCAVTAMIFVLRDSAHSWPRTAIVTALVLLPGVQLLLPVYNSQFALRAQLQHYQKRLEGQPMVVLCYPQRWDSISFYAPQAEVKTFLADERDQLLQQIRSKPGALLLVRSGRWTELLKQIPPDLEYVGEEKPGAIWAGYVRVRGQVDKSNRDRQLANQTGAPAWKSDINESD